MFLKCEGLNDATWGPMIEDIAFDLDMDVEHFADRDAYSADVLFDVDCFQTLGQKACASLALHYMPPMILAHLCVCPCMCVTRAQTNHPVLS